MFAANAGMKQLRNLCAGRNFGVSQERWGGAFFVVREIGQDSGFLAYFCLHSTVFRAIPVVRAQ